MAARRLALDAARGDRLQDAVDQDREGLDAGFVGAIRDQNQREVVAQLRQVPEAGKQSRPQVQPFGRLQAGAHSFAGQMEGKVRLKFGTHGVINPLFGSRATDSWPRLAQLPPAARP